MQGKKRRQDGKEGKGFVSCRTTDTPEPAAEPEEQPWMHSWSNRGARAPQGGGQSQPLPSLSLGRDPQCLGWGRGAPGAGVLPGLLLSLFWKVLLPPQEERDSAGRAWPDVGLQDGAASSAFALYSPRHGPGHGPAPAQLDSGCGSWQHRPDKGSRSPPALLRGCKRLKVSSRATLLCSTEEQSVAASPAPLPAPPALIASTLH